MKVFDTNTHPQRLTIPTVELVDFEELSLHEKTINQCDKKSSLENKKELNFQQQIFNHHINHIPQKNDSDQSFNIQKTFWGSWRQYLPISIGYFVKSFEKNTALKRLSINRHFL